MTSNHPSIYSYDQVLDVAIAAAQAAGALLRSEFHRLGEAGSGQADIDVNRRFP
jgi:hypothetical protein